MSGIQRLAPDDVISLIPEDAPFTAAQRAWLSGFLMALLMPPQPEKAEPRPTLAVAVLYASQTGSAEGLARKFAKLAKSRGFDAAARDIGTLSVAELAGLGHALVIAATHGEGEPPDTARGIAAALASAEGAPLAGLSFAVLALGDSAYLKFCGFGAFLDERLAALGGTRLADRVDCDGDPAPGYGSWREAIIGRLEQAAGMTAAPEVVAAEAADADEADEAGEAGWSRSNPFPAAIIDNRILNAAGSDKEVRHFALGLAQSGIAYEPGDSLGVAAENPPEMVEAILAATGFDRETAVRLDRDMTLAEALARRLSIGRLTQPSLIKFAVKANDPELSELLAPGHAEELAAFLYGRDAIDLLLRYPGAVATPQELVAMLPSLAPRLYSIASSLKAHPGEVHLTVSAVRYQSHGRARVGIASSFLADRAAAEPVGVYVQRNNRFRLPKDDATPIVMIGPGTGIAPFRAFLEERREAGARGRSWLFFGDRRKAVDFLYRDDLERFLKYGVLTRLDTAFSRDQAGKIYVQDRMMENAIALWHWLCDGAYVYVCGDASRMAKDVDRTLKAIVARQGRMSDAAAQIEVDQLIATGRYVRDVY